MLAVVMSHKLAVRWNRKRNSGVNWMDDGEDSLDGDSGDWAEFNGQCW